MQTYDKEKFLVFFNDLSSYEDLETIFSILEKKFDTVLIDKLDGPYSRIWTISINNEEMYLINNEPYGNSIEARNDNSKEQLKKILPNLETLFT